MLTTIKNEAGRRVWCARTRIVPVPTISSNKTPPKHAFHSTAGKIKAYHGSRRTLLIQIKLKFKQQLHRDRSGNNRERRCREIQSRKVRDHHRGHERSSHAGRCALRGNAPSLKRRRKLNF